jgi:hypothetical protein
MSVTRRGFLVGAAASTALILRPPSLPIPDVVLEAEIIEDVEPSTPVRITKLESFLKSRGIKPAHLAKESGYSRQHLLRVRMGKMEPTRKCIEALVVACQRITRDRRINANHLFDLGGRK